jgi:hypothetical protein
MNQNISKILFVTFATETWQNAGKRIIEEANNSNLFYKTICFTENDLDRIGFKNFYGDELSKTKGYGYYAWKSNLLKYLYENEEYDYLLYLDAGSEFNINSKNIDYFYNIVKKCQKNHFIVSKLKNEFLDKNWCKKITIETMKVIDVYSDQIQSGFILCDKYPLVKKIIDEWVYFSEFDNGVLINNLENRGIDEHFVDHRHDQSILSLILKKYKVESLEVDFWAEDWEGYDLIFAGTRNAKVLKKLKENNGI